MSEGTPQPAPPEVAGNPIEQEARKKISKLLKFSPDPQYMDQLNTYASVSLSSRIPQPYDNFGYLRDRFGEDTATMVCYEIDDAIGALRESFPAIVGTKLTDSGQFNKSLREQWTNQLTSLKESEEFSDEEIDDIDSAFGFWVDNRDDLENETLTRWDKVKGYVDTKKEKVTLASTLFMIGLGLQAKNRFGNSTDEQEDSGWWKSQKDKLRDTSLQAAEVMMQTPLWMQMQQEIAETTKEIQGNNEWSDENEQELIERVGEQYNIPAEKNPFIQNPGLIEKISKSSGSNVLAGGLRNVLGYGSYAYLLADPRTREIMDQLGTGASIGITSLLTGAATYLRYRSDKKALIKEGYTSHLPETAMFNALNMNAPEDETEEEKDKRKVKNAKKAASIGVAANTLWALHNPRWLPLIFGYPHYTTPSYIASMTGDQLAYMAVNRSATRGKEDVNAVKTRVKNYFGKGRHRQE